MKTSTKSFVSLCAMYFLASGLAFAEAEVSVDGKCGVLDENEMPVPGTDALSVSANNVNGNITITCTQDLDLDSRLGRSIIYSYDNTTDPVDSTKGRTCKVSTNPLIRTEDWHQVISASGKVKLTCHYKL